MNFKNILLFSLLLVTGFVSGVRLGPRKWKPDLKDYYLTDEKYALVNLLQVYRESEGDIRSFHCLKEDDENSDPCKFMHFLTNQKEHIESRIAKLELVLEDIENDDLVNDYYNTYYYKD